MIPAIARQLICRAAPCAPDCEAILKIVDNIDEIVCNSAARNGIKAPGMATYRHVVREQWGERRAVSVDNKPTDCALSVHSAWRAHHAMAVVVAKMPWRHRRR